MPRFDFCHTRLGGVYAIQRKLQEDARGFFSRFFCAEDFGAMGMSKPIAQINHTLTLRKGTVRGMHFQFPPHAESKIVSCLRGIIFDVVLDIRHDSKTFLHWHGEELSRDNRRSMYIPEGFAHGFQALSDECELLYLHTAPYRRDAEGALNAVDPGLTIAWPLPITEMSERDKTHPFINNDFRGITL